MGRNKRMSLQWLIRQGPGVLAAGAPPPTMRAEAALSVLIREQPRYQWFLDRVRETPRTWALGPRGTIRTPDGGCGGAKVAEQETGRIYSTTEWEAAFAIIQVPQFIASAVVVAFDNQPEHDPAIRRDLLIACGLLAEPVKVADPMDAELAAIIASAEVPAKETEAVLVS